MPTYAPARPARTFSSLATFVVLLVALACAGDGTAPEPSPLAGLVRSGASDSTGTPPPPAPTPGTPGYVRGTVLGQSPPGAGNDSLATAPRVVGARVALFPVTGGSTGNPELGPEAAAVVTGSDGIFVLPTVPGGPYAVTVTPPSGSIYMGTWITATIHGQSHTFPWWVVLIRR